MFLRIYNPKERIGIYQSIAEQTLEHFDKSAPVAVRFFEMDTAQGLMAGQTIGGNVTLWPDGYHIGIKSGERIASELRLLAHELAHVVEGHCQLCTSEEEFRRRDVNAARKIKAEDAAYYDRERQTDNRADQILALWAAWDIHV